MNSETVTGVTDSGVGMAPVESRPAWVSFLIHYGRQIGLPLAVLGLIAIFASSSEYFLNLQNFRNIGLQAAALAAVCFGQTAVIPVANNPDPRIY